MDETDVALQGMSFRLEENIAEELRTHSTDELFSAKTEFNETKEVTVGFVIHQILSKIYNLSFPSPFYLFTFSIVILIINISLLSRLYFGIPMFGDNVQEMIVCITLIVGFFWGLPVFIFGFVCYFVDPTAAGCVLEGWVCGRRRAVWLSASADLAADAKHSVRVKQLFARLLKQQKEMGDKVDLKAAFPKL